MMITQGPKMLPVSRNRSLSLLFEDRTTYPAPCGAGPLVDML